jgi:hypothetical protein
MIYNSKGLEVPKWVNASYGEIKWGMTKKIKKE